MVRIILADDHAMIRQALARALTDIDGFKIVGQANDAREALDLIARENPNVILMDIGMPGMDGLAATETIRKDYPKVKVLILTIHDREDYFFRALQAGAFGYILKGADIEELVEAIRVVAGGGIYLVPSLLPKLVADYLRLSQGDEAKSSPSDELTSRELEVLRLVAEGRTTKEIAQLLVISPHTVRRHRDHIMDKLALHSKAELILFAVRRGILEESS